MKPTVYGKQGRDLLHPLVCGPQTRLPAMCSNTHTAKSIRTSTDGTERRQEDRQKARKKKRKYDRKFLFL